MDLDLSWEKKLLIIFGVLALIIIIYAYNPFQETPEVLVHNQTYFPSQPITMPFNTSSGNESNQTNGTVTITSQQAKEIATEPNFTTGEPTSGTINLNNEVVAVWVVPLYQQNKLKKEVYVSKVNGNIVATREFN